MQCMSCQNEVTGSEAKLFLGVLLCAPCNTLSESLSRELERELSRAKDAAFSWLVTHILRGGLMRGTNADGTPVLAVRVEEQDRGAVGAVRPGGTAAEDLGG